MAWGTFGVLGRLCGLSGVPRIVCSIFGEALRWFWGPQECFRLFWGAVETLGWFGGPKDCLGQFWGPYISLGQFCGLVDMLWGELRALCVSLGMFWGPGNALQPWTRFGRGSGSALVIEGSFGVQGFPPYLKEEAEEGEGGRAGSLQQTPDALGLVQRHLQQVPLHHQLLQRPPRPLRQLQHRALQPRQHRAQRFQLCGDTASPGGTPRHQGRGGEKHTPQRGDVLDPRPPRTPTGLPGELYRPSRTHTGSTGSPLYPRGIPRAAAGGSTGSQHHRGMQRVHVGFLEPHVVLGLPGERTHTGAAGLPWDPWSPAPSLRLTWDPQGPAASPRSHEIYWVPLCSHGIHWDPGTYGIPGVPQWPLYSGGIYRTHTRIPRDPVSPALIWDPMDPSVTLDLQGSHRISGVPQCLPH